MSSTQIKRVNWYEAYSMNCKCVQNSCCNQCRNNYYQFSYVFKQQINYFRCVNGENYNWVPLTNNNGNVYILEETNVQLSSLLSENSCDITPINGLDIYTEYPDYSKTDVGQGKKWPSKVFSPFVDSTAWPPFKIADQYAITKVPYYNLGFIVSQNPKTCYPSWGTYYPAEAGPLNDQIKALRALGGDVTVSFGGSANVPIHVTAPDVETLKEQYKRFIIAYGLTRIDFDLEGAWIIKDEYNIKNSKALKLLQDELKALGKTIDIWFTLPILPTGLVASGIKVLQLALNEGVEIAGVNAMTMDYGDGPAPSPAGKMGQYGIQAITSLKNQLNTLYQGQKTEAELWAMVGTTPMIGINDIENEVFKQSDANETLSFAQNNNIGMISMWSANRDNSSQSRIPQTDNQFSIIFNAYNS